MDYLQALVERVRKYLPDWLYEQIHREAMSSAGGRAKASRIDPEQVAKEYVCHFVYKEDEKRIVYGIVLEPDTVDSQGDVIAAEEIEKAAHRFLQDSRTIGDSHRKVAQAQVVESFIAPENFQMAGQPVKQGSWVMAVKVLDDQLWQQVRAGEYTGFSVGGFGVREEVA